MATRIREKMPRRMQDTLDRTDHRREAKGGATGGAYTKRVNERIRTFADERARAERELAKIGVSSGAFTSTAQDLRARLQNVDTATNLNAMDAARKQRLADVGAELVAAINNLTNNPRELQNIMAEQQRAYVGEALDSQRKTLKPLEKESELLSKYTDRVKDLATGGPVARRLYNSTKKRMMKNTDKLIGQMDDITEHVRELHEAKVVLELFANVRQQIKQGNTNDAVLSAIQFYQRYAPGGTGHTHQPPPQQQQTHQQQNPQQTQPQPVQQQTNAQGLNATQSQQLAESFAERQAGLVALGDEVIRTVRNAEAAARTVNPSLISTADRELATAVHDFNTQARLLFLAGRMYMTKLDLVDKNALAIQLKNANDIVNDVASKSGGRYSPQPIVPQPKQPRYFKHWVKTRGMINKIAPKKDHATDTIVKGTNDIFTAFLAGATYDESRKRMEKKNVSALEMHLKEKREREIFHRWINEDIGAFNAAGGANTFVNAPQQPGYTVGNGVVLATATATPPAPTTGGPTATSPPPASLWV